MRPPIGQFPAAAWNPGPPGRRGGAGQARRGDHRPDEPRRDWPAGLPAVDRPPHQTVPPPPAPLTAFERKTGWKHSIICTNVPAGGIGACPAATIPSSSASCTANTPSSRPQASAPPRPWACATSLEDLAGQRRLDDCREHRRRPRRLDPPPRLLRRRTPGSQPGHAPDLAHPRPPRRPRPAASPEDQPRLALEGRVPRLLAAALHPASTSLTSTSHPADAKGGPVRRGRSRCAPGHPGHTKSPPRPRRNGHEAKNARQHNQ